VKSSEESFSTAAPDFVNRGRMSRRLRFFDGFVEAVNPLTNGQISAVLAP
jgi:hypothetical protein